MFPAFYRLPFVPRRRLGRLGGGDGGRGGIGAAGAAAVVVVQRVNGGGVS